MVVGDWKKLNVEDVYPKHCNNDEAIKYTNLSALLKAFSVMHHKVSRLITDRK